MTNAPGHPLRGFFILSGDKEMPTKYVKMIAKKSMRYRTRAMTAGEEFEAHGESDARLYQALGYADRKKAEVEPPPVVVEEQPAPRAYKRAAKKTSRWAPLAFTSEPAANIEDKTEDEA